MNHRGKNYIYGKHPVTELLCRSPKAVLRLYIASAGKLGRLSDVVKVAQRNEIQIVTLAKRAMGDLVGEVNHQGVVALVAPYQYVSVQDMLALAHQRGEAPMLLALDSIQDPHNVGALVRSALALGAHGVLLLKDRACEVTPTVVKSSSGAANLLPIARVTNMRRSLDDLKDAGLWIVGTVAEGGQHLSQVDLIQPTVLVVGSEGKGLRPLVEKGCDILANIPMSHPISLNASVAGGICLYEALRQRLAS